MAKQWTVETEQLTGAANVLEEQIADYNTQWQRLYTEVENLKASQWKGIASDAFNTQLEGYRDDFEALRDILVSFKDFLITAAEKYTKTEDAVNNAAKSLIS